MLKSITTGDNYVISWKLSYNFYKKIKKLLKMNK